MDLCKDQKIVQLVGATKVCSISVMLGNQKTGVVMEVDDSRGVSKNPDIVG